MTMSSSDYECTQNFIKKNSQTSSNDSRTHKMFTKVQFYQQRLKMTQGLYKDSQPTYISIKNTWNS